VLFVPAKTKASCELEEGKQALPFVRSTAEGNGDIPVSKNIVQLVHLIECCQYVKL
jgi:hypothetical protein